jgi:TolB-like protein
MKKRILLTIFILTRAMLFSQNTVTLDNAIDDYARGLAENIQRDRGVAVIAFETERRELTEYLIDTAIEKLWERGVRPIYERQRLEILQRELNYSLSGDVSDETALRIGQRIGVNTVVYGTIRRIGNNYRINLRATNVETAQLVYPRSYDLRMDSRLSGLLGISTTANTNERRDVTIYDGSRPDPRVPDVDVSRLDRNTRAVYDGWISSSNDQFRRYRTNAEFVEFIEWQTARDIAAGRRAPNEAEHYREFVSWYVSATPTSALEAEIRRQARERELRQAEESRMDVILQGRTAEEVWNDAGR